MWRVNAFFISLGALLPRANLGWITLAMSLVSLLNSLILGWTLLRHRARWPRVLRRSFMIVVSLTLYGFELYYAVVLLLSPSLVSAVFALATLLLGIYGVGLVRAWELLGARRHGLLSWLNPLYETGSVETMTNVDQSSTEKRAVNDAASQAQRSER